MEEETKKWCSCQDYPEYLLGGNEEHVPFPPFFFYPINTLEEATDSQVAK